MACSGSVSLELLAAAKPSVVLYRISRLAYWVQGFFRKTKYITLVNLLAEGREKGAVPLCSQRPSAGSWKRGQSPFPGAAAMFPEYLTWEDRSAEIAAHVVEWLSQPERRAARVAELERLRAEVARPGARGGRRRLF